MTASGEVHDVRLKAQQRRLDIRHLTVEVVLQNDADLPCRQFVEEVIPVNGPLDDVFELIHVGVPSAGRGGGEEENAESVSCPWKA